ncbi:unnamed protein product [Ectocarpus sp. 12 AP-2014]
MGEDIWSLVSRQLYATSSANPRQQQAEEVKDDGDTEAPGEGGDPADSADKITAVCAFASYALCVGMPGAGKSTLLNTYLNPNNDSIPKPTVALEYMFARRASAPNMPKDVAHIWELGGGSHVSDLVRVPITPDRFHDALYVIVVDLSRPSSVIPHLLQWTDQIKACVKVCVRELGKRDPTFGETLKRKTYAKLGRDHPDLRAVRPCPVPLVIVGNKYDVFKNQESARKRILAQALRFVAHINGASLLFCSSREKKLKDILRLTLNTHLFRAGSRKSRETNPERPLVVAAGCDSLDSILKNTPPGTRRDDFLSGNGIADGAMGVWKRTVEDVFGPPDRADELVGNSGGGDDYGSSGKRDEGDGGDKNNDTDNPFPEAAVDEHRAQRDEILRRYRKDAERKAKLAMKASTGPHHQQKGGAIAGGSSGSGSGGRGSGVAPPGRRRSRSSEGSNGSKDAPPSSRK